MEYREYNPIPELKAFIKCFWVLEDYSKEAIEKQRIVPDGCMEMIFHYGDLYRQYSSDGKSWVVQPKSFVFGQITRPLYIEPTGVSGVFSVRFHPGGFRPFTTKPVSEFNDRAVALEDLYGMEGRELEAAVIEAVSIDERLKLCQNFLLGRLSSMSQIDHIIQEAVQIILNERGSMSVGEISEITKVQRRKLERRFSKVIGLSPKQLSKVIRLSSTIQKMLKTQHESMTSLAYEGEYFDQAHFIKDFKELTGQTPKSFYSNDLKMSALLHKRE